MNGQQTKTLFTAEDIAKNKVISALAYLIFFLPLIVCPDSPFGRFHANQGLLLLIAGIGGSVILAVIPIISLILLPFFSLAVFIFAVIGLTGALSGKARDLPLIGRYRLLK
jgi:uncharacterized membrane protein